MMLRRSQQVAVALAGVIVPLAASAQNGGSVTIAPLGSAAPALSFQLLGVLAVALSIVAIFMLRRSRRAVSYVIALVAVTMTAGIGYSAASNVTVSGSECNQVTVIPFDAHGDLDLQSQCPNPIRIVDLELDCNEPCDEIEGETLPPLPACEVGLIMDPGKACHLPACHDM